MRKTASVQPRHEEAHGESSRGRHKRRKTRRAVSIADRAMSTQLFHVPVMCCDASALTMLLRASDTDGATGWRWLEKRTRHCRTSWIPSHVFVDTRGSLDTLDLLIHQYESSTGTPLAEPLKALVQRAGDTDAGPLDSTRTRDHRAADEHLRSCQGQEGWQRQRQRERACREQRTHQGTGPRTQTKMFSGKNGHRKRDRRKRARQQGSGQQTLADNAPPPGCEAYDQDERSWIIMLGLDSLRNDGSDERNKLLIYSACSPQVCAGTTSRPTPGADVNFQVADVDRQIIAVRDLMAMGCVVHAPRSAHSDWWTSVEAGTGTVDSLQEVLKTWSNNEIVPLEVPLIPEAETEACCQLTTTERNASPTCHSNSAP